MLVYLILIMSVGILAKITLHNGLEKAIPIFCFITVISPQESKIQLAGLFDINTQRIALITIIILLVIFGSYNDPVRENSKATPLKTIMLLHIFFSLISVYYSVVPLISFKRVVFQVLEYYLLYFIMTKVITNIETIRNCLIAIVAAVSISSILGFIEAYTGWSVISLFPMATYRFQQGIDLARGLRIRATFPHAILFGGAISMAVPIAFYISSITQSFGQRLLLWLGIILMFGSVYHTMSRGPWIALIISLTLMFIFCANSIRKYTMYVVVLSGVLLILRPGVLETIRNLFFATFDSDTLVGSSYSYRYALIEVVKEAISRDLIRLLFGYGQDSFFYLGLKSDFLGKPFTFLSCDSAWIELMSDTGYVGLTIMILLTAKITLITFYNYIQTRKVSPYKDISFILLVNLIAFYFLMTNVAIYGWGQNGHIFWIIVSLSVVYGRILKEESTLQYLQNTDDRNVFVPTTNLVK